MMLRVQSLPASPARVALWGGVAGVLAVVLASPATAGPARPAAAAECSPAYAALKANRPNEAARAFETCAQATGDLSHWKRAGMARYSSRQFAHAIHAMRRYQATGADDDQAQVIVLDAQRNTVKVPFTVQVAPGATRPVVLRVVPGDGSDDAIEVPWSETTSTTEVWLDPGKWIVELVMVDASVVGTQSVVVRRGVAPSEVVFRLLSPMDPASESGGDLPKVDVINPTDDLPPLAPVVKAQGNGETAPVEIFLAPPAARRAGIALQWHGLGAPPVVRVHDEKISQALPPGSRDLEVWAPKFRRQSYAVDIVPGSGARLRVNLQRDSHERARIGLGAGLGAASLGLLGVGIGLHVHGSNGYNAAAPPGQDLDLAATDRALSAAQTRFTGAMLIGAGTGAAVAAISTGVDFSDKVLIAEAGIGAGLLLGGIIWTTRARRQFGADESVPLQRSDLDGPRRSEAWGAGMLGIGVGLATSASITLVTRTILKRHSRRKATQVTPVAGPTTLGLAISARF